MHELDSVRVKIARGEVHYADFSAALDSWRISKPYSIVPELEPDTGYQVWKVDQEPILPPVFPSLGDALYNFRSALDHLAHQLVLKGGGKPTTSTEFPIFIDQDGFLSTRGQQKMHGMSDAMKGLIKANQPCFGANSNENRTLWALQQYGNVDKHRKLVVVATAMSGILWNPSGGDDNVFIHEGPVEKDTVLARFPPAYMKTNIRVMAGISFGEAPRLNEDIQLVVHSIKTWVPRIVDQFEKAFF